jgi:glycosyltransferase involved in cell wall biosynthesis
MKVLHVIPNLELGGAARGATELVEYLQRYDDIAPELCVLGAAGEDWHGGELKYPCTFLGLDAPTRSVRALYRGARALAGLVARLNPDIVHSHLVPADVTAALALVGSRRIHVAHIRDTRGWLTSRRPADRLRRCLYRSTFAAAGTRFLSVSIYAADFVSTHLRLPAARVRVVPNGIDLRRFARSGGHSSAPTRKRPVIGSAGRLVEEKGFRTLVSAVAQIVREGADVELVLAGAGSCRQALLAQAEAEGIGSRCSILGIVRDMTQFYQGIDIFVLSSLMEGLPRCVLEAMACGVPVVATRVGGVVEVVNDGENGLLVGAEDSGSMAAAITRLLSDQALREKFCDTGRSRVLQQFTVDRVASDVRNYYRDICHTHC